MDIKFEEPPLIEKKKAKGKPKRKKKVKKGAKKAKTEEPKAPPMTFHQKEFMLNEEYKKAHNCDDPEVEIIHDTHSWNMDIEMAIRVIQRNERGRQGRGRIMLFLKKIKDDQLMEEKRRLAKMQKSETPAQPQYQEHYYAEFISRRIRGIIARKKVEEMRNEEMIFLGMTRRPKTAVTRDKDPLQIMADTREHRKKLQENNWVEFQTAKNDIQNEMTDIDYQDIQDHMLKERRDWI